MEKRQLLALIKKADCNRTARVWRITQGELDSETGKLRVALYRNGKRIPHMHGLFSDRARADAIALRWLRYAVIG